MKRRLEYLWVYILLMIKFIISDILLSIANSQQFYASILSKFKFSEFQIFLTFQKMNLLPLIMSNFLQIKKDNFHRMMFFKLQLILYLMANQRLLIQCAITTKYCFQTLNYIQIVILFVLLIYSLPYTSIYVANHYLPSIHI